MGFFGRGRTTVTRADKISNFTVSTAEYGSPVMEVLGTTRVSGNVIYYDDFTAHEHREEHRTGKGGGKSKSVSITYTYTVACILGLCEGPIAGIRRMWVGKEIYTYPNDKVPLTLFYGTADQQPWAYVVGKHPEKALPYTNLAYMAGVIDLGDSASMQNYNFEVAGQLLSTGDGTDVNPMDYIQYVLGKAGQRYAVFQGAENFRSYCANADFLISTPMDATNAQPVREMVNSIAELCGAYVFWSNDSYKIVPLADRPVGGWLPDKTIRYDLTVDDFMPQNGTCVSWSRKDSTEQYNRFTVEFNNRANGYEKESVTYEDASDIAERGVVQAPTIQAGYIYTKERAVMVAENAARRSKVGKNQYKFKLGWAFCRLEPGDLVRITDEASGILNQVVLIQDIQEGADGLLNVTALSWFQDDYGAAEYDVHEIDRPDIDFNRDPGNTDIPAIFQPPADLTSSGLEVWIGAKGVTPENWGGCTVYVSDDNEHYRTLGQITNNARFGPLVSNISATATSMEVAIDGTMLSGTEQDAQRGNTLLWLDAECMSYQTATLLPNGHYRLDGLIRGQYNTTAAAHSSGGTVIRCDETLLRAPFAKEDVGKKLYLKFCSYNIFGAAEQSLADVQAYEYTLQPYYIPPVRNLTARNRYRQLKDGVHRYDIVVHWDEPELQSFMSARVWYKTNAGQTKYLTFQKNVPINRLGFSGEWNFGGEGKNEVVIPQAIVGDIYRIAVTTVDQWGVETSPDAAPQVEIQVALKTETPNTPDGFGIAFGDAPVVSWAEVANTDIAFYEVRLDANPGAENANLLARVTGLTTSLTLTSRTGRLYLYAYSASGKYSAPAILDYNKPAPPKPPEIRLTGKLGGFSLVVEPIPAGCNGMNIYINSYNDSVKVHTINNTYTHTCDAGGYDVTVAYTDIFGEGPLSDERSVVIKAVVDQALLDAEAVSKEKLDSTLKTAVDNANQSVTDINALRKSVGDNASEITKTNNSVTAVARRVGNNEEDISALQVQANEISSAVFETTQSGTKVSRIAQNANGISAVVTNLNDSTKARQNYTVIQVMQDGIASKCSLDDATSYFQQTHQGFLIEGSLIHISGNTLIDNGIITADMLQAGCITADAIYQAGYKVKNITFLTGIINIPRTSDAWYEIPRPNGYTAAECISMAYDTVNPNVASGNAYCTVDVDMDQNGITRVKLREIRNQPQDITNIPVRYKTIGIK